MPSNFEMAIMILLLMCAQAGILYAPFFIRANISEPYTSKHPFHHFIWLYKLTSQKYPAHVNIKARILLVGIPLLIISMLVVFIMSNLSSSSQYSQKFDFHAAWLKEQIDEERARSIIETSIEESSKNYCFAVYFTGKKMLDSKKYDAHEVRIADKGEVSDFFDKVREKDELWTFEVDQDSLEHVAYIDGIVLVKNGEPVIAIALTRNDKIGLPF